MNEFKEVSETLKTKLSESTLGKQLSGIKILTLAMKWIDLCKKLHKKMLK